MWLCSKVLYLLDIYLLSALRAKQSNLGANVRLIASGLLRRAFAPLHNDDNYLRIFPLLLCLVLASCGFHPLYAPYTEGCNVVSYPLKIATISERKGQILRNYLVDLLTPAGPPLKSRYTLEIKLTEAVENTVVLRDATSSRKRLTLTAAICLKDLSNKIIYTHSTSSLSSFAILGQSYYADSVAEEYAKKEALRTLAEKIKLLVSAYLESVEPSVNPEKGPNIFHPPAIKSQ